MARARDVLVAEEALVPVVGDVLDHVALGQAAPPEGVAEEVLDPVGDQAAKGLGHVRSLVLYLIRIFHEDGEGPRAVVVEGRVEVEDDDRGRIALCRDGRNLLQDLLEKADLMRQRRGSQAARKLLHADGNFQRNCAAKLRRRCGCGVHPIAL